MALNSTAETTRLSTPDTHLIEQTEYRAYDSLIAVAFSVCLVVGLPGNSLALSYFIQTKKRNLPTLLYISACSIDILSSMIHLPVTINLFNGREPGLFHYRGFCCGWFAVLLLLQLTSAFVVMMISISRALVIINPFKKIRKRYVLSPIILTLIVYLCNFVIINAINGERSYSYAVSYCILSPRDKILGILNASIFTALIGIPPIIVFFTSLISIIKLQTQGSINASRQNNRHSSVTMIYFSAIYLVCNIINFSNNTLLIYGSMTRGGELINSRSIYIKSRFLFFYSWILSEIFCPVLNASLNPILYFCRMKEMRLWLFRLLGARNRTPGSTSVAELNS